MASDGPAGSASQDVEEQIRQAAREFHAANGLVARARRDLGLKISLGRRAGLTWRQVADDAGISVNAARFLVESINITGSTSRSRRPQPGTVAVNVSEAARRLGVTRPTVYAHIRRGLLRTIQDDRGGTLVVLDE